MFDGKRSGNKGGSLHGYHGATAPHPTETRPAGKCIHYFLPVLLCVSYMSLFRSASFGICCRDGGVRGR